MEALQEALGKFAVSRESLSERLTILEVRVREIALFEAQEDGDQPTAGMGG
jgi:hypothetical protein